ncbi:MAG: thioredoxin domain-containing protein [Bacteroidetes bacterium]|nr:thioredoxin domain-containing protein [Bacteroidota bacterium]
MKKECVVITILIGLILCSCYGQNKENNENKIMKQNYTNELIHETSPYLLQHAHNPVNWYPWGDKALQKAKDEHKLVIISIGYAACHWCHVMEHESFEDIDAAKYMNEYFVCLKVDREERPDVDQIYMTAAQLLTGRGGWPLNALALPDGKPFYAGTYFPKKRWLDMLAYFVDVQKKNPKALIEQSQKITNGIINTENIEFSSEKSIATIEDINKVFASWKSSIDFNKGGENRAPKFPMPSDWEYLMQYYSMTKNNDALEAVTVTLDNMAFGGIYDQIGGGFSRYSTDEDWKVPHFEKMLYDNAQLVSLYSHAFQLTKKPLYKQVVFETLEFIESELTSPDSTFYSSLDADSEGEEGKYYVWSYDEIKAILGENAPLFIDYYNIYHYGNWEQNYNILFRKISDEEIAKKYKISIQELKTQLNNDKKILEHIRSKRVKPMLDDKIITAWNALMIKGYVDAYRVFGENKYLQKAIINAEFILKNIINKNNELTRNYKNNKATIPALLDDYAFTISAFISLYQATFDEKWLYKAKDINDYVLLHFFDIESGMFFYTNKNYSNLIARKMEVADNVIPSSNSEMAKNLFTLGLYFDNDEYVKKSIQMFCNVQKNVHENIRFYSNWGSLELQLIQSPNEIAIVGNDYEKIRKSFDNHYLPNSIFLGGKNEGTLSLLKDKVIPNQTTIYVCRSKSCKLPTTTVEDALKQLKN